MGTTPKDSSGDFPMDYDSLRREGIRLIEKLGSKQWTDYNTHDPGITILEQLCYALTDLVYRIDYPVHDILAEGGADPYASLIPPKEILPSGPVTLLDLRKIVLDVEGVRNAWVERFVPEFNNAEPPIYWSRQNKTLTLSKDDQTEPLIIQGLYQVWVEADTTWIKSKEGQDEALLEKTVRECLQIYRSVCEDFNVTVLKDAHIEKIGITASIEVDAAADFTKVNKDIFQKIKNYFSPPVQFYSLNEYLDKIKYLDEIFEGPFLSNGFIDNEELKKNIRRTELRTSDLIQLFMDIKGVLAVKKIAFVKEGNPSEEKWLLKLEKGKIPRLDEKITKIDPFKDTITDESATTVALLHPSVIDNLPLPTSQNRHINKKYFSIQHQFPDCYGINSRGLSNSASPLRKAQAKQLKAYLLLFDQLLANEFAQLANAGKLFSFAEEDADISSYFFKLLDDSEQGLGAEDEKNRIWTESKKQQRLSQLEKIFSDSGEKELERKNRFLDHLSARFAEQLVDYSQESKNISNDIECKKKWLRNYAEISRNRANSYCKPADADNRTGLERRLRLKFNIGNKEPFYLIEHILLRPIKQDENNSNAPAILVDTQDNNNDPYSLHITIVHYEGILSLRPYIREELPAHLNVNFYPSWRETDKQSGEKFNTISEVYLKWRQAMMNDDSPNRQKLRATRDRLIDLLGIGETYPLIDLDIKKEYVIYGQQAKICIIFGQPDVEYQIFDDTENKEDSISERSGEDIVLTINNPIKKKMIYTVKAKKNNFDAIEMSAKAIVHVGINTGVEAKIIKEIRVGNEHHDITEQPIINFGSKVEMQLDDVQYGVQYRLFSKKNGNKNVLSAYAKKEGTEKGIILESESLEEDAEIFIEVKKIDSDQSEDTEELKKHLPVMVRAKQDIKIIKNNAVYKHDIVALGEKVGIQLQDTQEGVNYKIFQRPLIDDDFSFSKDEDERTKLPIPVDGFAALQVKVPEPISDWEKIPTVYSQNGDEKDGTGGQLILSTESVNTDSLIVIRAKKKHKEGHSSAVQLEQIVVLLVEPYSDQLLSLKLHIKDGKYFLQVANGETGVFYHFRLEKNGDEICLPAYFHQWADGDNSENKGIEELVIGRDFVIADSETKPEYIELKLDQPLQINEESLLYIRARKSRTNVWIDLEPRKLSEIK